MSNQSNFERVVGEAVANPTFAEELREATNKIKDDRENTQPILDAIANNENLGFTLADNELNKMVDVIQDIDFDAIADVARAFGDDQGGNN